MSDERVEAHPVIPALTCLRHCEHTFSNAGRHYDGESTCLLKNAADYQADACVLAWLFPDWTDARWSASSAAEAEADGHEIADVHWSAVLAS